MDAIKRLEGYCLPLAVSSVDTDQIISSEYLKRVARTGFEEGLFREWRKEPDFVFNNPAYNRASILVTGSDFGTGSSREQAVWALQDYGFRAVISPSFGDIFRNNALRSGLLAIELELAAVQMLLQTVARQPMTRISIDVLDQTLAWPGTDLRFELDPFARRRFTEGLDDIEMTLGRMADVQRYESGRPEFMPRL